MSHIVAKDGATILGFGEQVGLVADGVATKAITVQLRSGDDESGSPSDEIGAGEQVAVHPQGGVVPMDKMWDNLDGAGKVVFTFGPYAVGSYGLIDLAFECMAISPERGKRAGITLVVTP